MLYIGIDLGTSAAKLLLMDESGSIHKVVSREYPLEFPKPGWSQQNPEDWKNAVMDGLAALTAECDKTQIAGIGCGGQMHGLVILDKGLSQNDFTESCEAAPLFAASGIELVEKIAKSP